MISKSDIKRLKSHYNAKIKTDLILDASGEHHDKHIFLTELKNTKFCTNRFIKYLDESCDKYMCFYSDTVKLHVYYDRKHMVPIAKIMKSVRQVTAIQKYFGIDKMFEIYINMCPYERYIDENVMTADHINGGFTSTIGNKIFIIRSQEFSKVIIHEVLHHCKQIHNNDWNISDIMRLKNAFKIGKSTLLVPNEAVVELWACCIHCLFMSFEYGIHADILIAAEQEHSLIQCNKIIEKQKKQLNSEWNEDTNSYCYIIFKTIMLCNMHKLNVHMMHDTKYITQFLIDHANDLKLHQDNNNGFRMMKTSDY
jgi:hypothetical protein